MIPVSSDIRQLIQSVYRDIGSVSSVYAAAEQEGRVVVVYVVRGLSSSLLTTFDAETTLEAAFPDVFFYYHTRRSSEADFDLPDNLKVL